MKRYLISEPEKRITELRPDSIDRNAVIKFTYKALDRFIGSRIKLRKLSIAETDSGFIHKDLQAMFQRFAQDSVVSYSFDDSFIQRLKKNGVKRILVIKIYWEYYDQNTYKKVYIGSGHAGWSDYPSTPACISGSGVVIDLNTAQVTYCQTKQLYQELIFAL